MLDGIIKFLKIGKIGIFLIFVKVFRNVWLKEYVNRENMLKVMLILIVIFVNDKGLGIVSFKGSKVKFKELEILEILKIIIVLVYFCFKDYIFEGYCYCILKNFERNWIRVIILKIVIEKIFFFGFRIDNYVLKDIDFDMRLFLSEVMYLYWIVGIDVGLVIFIMIKFGESFKGKGLKLEYIIFCEVNF